MYTRSACVRAVREAIPRNPSTKKRGLKLSERRGIPRSARRARDVLKIPESRFRTKASQNRSEHL